MPRTHTLGGREINKVVNSCQKDIPLFSLSICREIVMVAQQGQRLFKIQ